jgi:hypothetical protein
MKKNNDFVSDPSKKPEVVKPHPMFKKVVAYINKEKRKGMFLESVILSRWDFDMLEKWFISVGIINELTENIPIDWKGVEIKRGSASVTDFVPEYKILDNAKQQLINLAENEDIFKIKDKRNLDAAYRKIKGDKRNGLK